MHTHRLSANDIAPVAMTALRAVETYLHQSGARQESHRTVYDEVRRQFGDEELADLATLIGMINVQNPLAISLRYQHLVD
jgi:hypothetical protein